MRKLLFTFVLVSAAVSLSAQAGADNTSAELHSGYITTTVYPLGYISYDGDEGHYTIGNGNASTIYANGLWLANAEHASVRQYGASGNDFQTGPLKVDGSASTDSAVVAAFNRVWFVSREMIDYHLAHYNDAGYEPAEAIATWPGNGPDGAYASILAPFVDLDADGIYNPLQGDYPLIKGDECVFSIFNDACTHAESNGQGMGVEVHSMTYAFNNQQDMALWNTVFVHYDLFNRSADTYDGTYVGMWTDYDIGYCFDDRIGCDVRRGMYYGYNSFESDGQGAGRFPGVPPAQGCMLLGGPWQQPDGKDNSRVNIAYIESDMNPNTTTRQYLEQFRLPDGSIDTVEVNRHAHDFYSLDYRTWYFLPGDSTGNQCINGEGFGDGIVDNERIGMTNFLYYENSIGVNGMPTTADHYYNYLRSFWKNGAHVKFSGKGTYGTVNASFMYPGDSDPWFWGTDGVVPEDNPYDWVDGDAPGDRRGVASSGPFSFQPSGTRSNGRGSWQEFDVAYITAGADSIWEAVNALRMGCDQVRYQWSTDTTYGGNAFSYIPVTSQNGIESAENLRLDVWPNPTTGMLWVEADGNQPLQLLDIMGRTVMTAQTYGGGAVLDLAALPQGFYILRMGGTVKRIIKR